MVNTVPLMDYLQTALLAIPTHEPAKPSYNTTNTAYGPDDIGTLDQWQDFSLANIRQTYQNLLTQVTLPPDPMPLSPPEGITSKGVLAARVGEYIIPRVRRSLRAAFTHITANNQMNDINRIRVSSRRPI